MKSIYKKALKQIIDFLEMLEKSEGIKYYLVGGILVNLYADFRTTRDIDLVIDFESSQITVEDYINILQDYDFFPFQDWESALLLANETKIIQFLDISETVRYDNHIIERNSKSKYKKIGPLALERRKKEVIFGVQCWVVSKEDFILSKLVYGGWQDYADALACWMRFNEKLDLEYLKNISKQLGIQREIELLKSGLNDPDEFFRELRNT